MNRPEFFAFFFQHVLNIIPATTILFLKWNIAKFTLPVNAIKYKTLGYTEKKIEKTKIDQYQSYLI